MLLFNCFILSNTLPWPDLLAGEPPPHKFFPFPRDGMGDPRGPVGAPEGGDIGDARPPAAPPAEPNSIASAPPPPELPPPPPFKPAHHPTPRELLLLPTSPAPFPVLFPAFCGKPFKSTTLMRSTTLTRSFSVRSS